MVSMRVLTVTAAMTFLAACGGGGGDGGSGGSAGGDEVVDPISEFLGFGEFDEDAEQQRYLDQERERQALIAECMAGEGFTYTPVEPDQGAEVTSFPGQDLSPAEFAEQFGYGMSTTLDQQFEPTEDEFVDPNAATVEAMSDTEQEAWNTALYGDVEEQTREPTVDEEGEDIEAGPAPGFGGGCDGEASEAVYGGDEEQFEEFNDLWEDYDERLRSDRRFVEAEESWRACMGERGYDFDEQEDAFEAVNERMDEIYSVMDPTAGMSEDEIVALSPEELDALYTEASDIEPDPDLVAEIQEFERAVAVADFECAGPIRDATEAIGQDFLDEHREEFERYRDLLEEQSGGAG